MFVYMYVSHIHVMCLDTKAYIARFGNRTNVLQHGYTCVRDRKIDVVGLRHLDLDFFKLCKHVNLFFLKSPHNHRFVLG